MGDIFHQLASSSKKDCRGSQADDQCKFDADETARTTDASWIRRGFLSREHGREHIQRVRVMQSHRRISCRHSLFAI